MFRITVPYKDRPKASITVALLKEPYGKDSEDVVSVGCTLKGDIDNPTWKVHIPTSILSDVIASLREINSFDFKNCADS